MKFGRQLSELVDPKFRTYCVSYNMLKTFIRDPDVKTGKVIQTIQDVTSAAVPYLPHAPAEQIPSVLFQEALGGELEKVNRFSELEQEAILTDLRGVIRRIYGLDRSSPSFAGAAESISSEVDRIAEEACAFAGFVNLNYTAFRKITKKEAKVHRTSSAAWFMANVARAAFMNVDFERLLSAISICYELLRSSHAAIESTPMARVALDSDRVMSAWIAGDDLWEVKVALSKVMSLELFVPGGSRQGLLDAIVASGRKSKDTSVLGHCEVTATYFDTPWLESYKEQVTGHVPRGFQTESDGSSTIVSLPSGNRFTVASTQWGDMLALKDQPEDPDCALELSKLISSGYTPMVTCEYSRYVFYTCDEEYGQIEVRVEEQAAFRHSGDKLEDKHSKFTGHALYISASRELPEWLTDITGMPGVTEVPHFSKRVHGLFLYADRAIGAGVPCPSWAIQRSTAGKVRPLHTRPVTFDEPKTGDHSALPELVQVQQPTSCTTQVMHFVKRLMGTSTSPKAKALQIRDAMIKIEPKSFFACERNLLDWTHTCVVVSGLAALHGGLIGLVLAVVPIIILVWETRLHRVRNAEMMAKEGVDYSDAIGPYLLFAVLICLCLAVVVDSGSSLLIAQLGARK